MKKFDFTRIILLLTSIAILTLGYFIPNTDFKYFIIFTLIIFAAIILDVNIPKITKLSEDNPKVKTARLLSRLSIFTLIIFSLFEILSSVDGLIAPRTKDLLTVGLLSGFLMIYGNLSPKIPFNRYIGLRLPWTIRDEDTWKVGNKLVGYLAVPISIIMFVLSFFFNTDKVVFISISVIVAIPSLYSLLFYYKKYRIVKK